jgi:hypothetical protein
MREAKAVKTKLYYLAPLEKYLTTKPYFVNWPVHDTPGAEQTNLSHKIYNDIYINDIRGSENEFRIDTQGFQLVSHSTALTNDDFEDDSVIRAKYYPEIENLIKTTLGATRVLVFEHTVNTHGCYFM